MNAYATEMAWREDNRRISNGEQFLLATGAALAHPEYFTGDEREIKTFADSLASQSTLVILGARETVVMSDEDRRVLLACMQATLAEAKRMTPQQARARLEEEAQLKTHEFVESPPARA